MGTFGEVVRAAVDGMVGYPYLETAAVYKQAMARVQVFQVAEVGVAETGAEGEA